MHTSADGPTGLSAVLDPRQPGQSRSILITARRIL